MGPAVILWPPLGNDAREGLIHSSRRAWTGVFKSRVYHEGTGCPQQSHSKCPVTFSAHPERGWCPLPLMRFRGRMNRGSKSELSIVTATSPQAYRIILQKENRHERGLR